MNVRAVVAVGALAFAGFASCEDHEPVIVGNSGGMPMIDGGEPIGRTDPVPWCDVNRVLECKCRRCHTEPPENGAPFPLLTYEDTQVTRGASTRRVWQRMRNVIAQDFMPPTFLDDLVPPVEMATDYEKATIIGWADQGAMALGGIDCAPVNLDECPKVPAGGAGGEGGVGGASGAGAGGMSQGGAGMSGGGMSGAGMGGG